MIKISECATCPIALNCCRAKELEKTPGSRIISLEIDKDVRKTCNPVIVKDKEGQGYKCSYLTETGCMLKNKPTPCSVYPFFPMKSSSNSAVNGIGLGISAKCPAINADIKNVFLTGESKYLKDSGKVFKWLLSSLSEKDLNDWAESVMGFGIIIDVTNLAENQKNASTYVSNPVKVEK